MYSILGVSSTASAADIKERYRFLCHAYHPDKFSNEAHRAAAEKEFKKINEAYRVLSDPTTRIHYDNTRTPPSSSRQQDRPRQAPLQESPSHEKSGRRRLFLLTLSALVLLISIGFIVSFLEYEGRDAERVKTLKRLIQPTEIEVEELVLTPRPAQGEHFTLRRTFDVSGRIRNLSSSQTVLLITVRIILRDAEKTGSGGIVGEEEVHLAARVPPQQERGVSGAVTFENIPRTASEFQYSCTVVDVINK